MKRLAICSALTALLLTTAATANETQWSGAINPLSPEAQEIRRKPILERPDRPGHIYGNTVRRMHRRGNPLPLQRDFSKAAGVWWGR